MSFQTHILSNGLRIIHRQFPSEISYCGLAVNTGTRDEKADEHGMAHFVEHLLFKGTKKRKAHQIANRMENVGGELNAYTTKEETFIYATFLTEYFERATELLSDILLQSAFLESQIEKEREVILDEINSYNDSPAELIYDDFENLAFAGHALGHYILGTPQSLHTFDRAKVVGFVQRQYRPDNMVLFSSGKTPFKKVVQLAEKYFNSFAKPSIDVVKRTPPFLEVAQQLSVEKKTAQTHIMLGMPALDMFHRDRYVLYLLNHVIGGGVINSRLNNSLREKNGLVYQVESALTAYTDAGLFSVYFACDKKHVARCLKLIEKEFEKLRETPLTPAQLATAKRQYKGQLGIASESNENVTLRMAKSYLHFHNYTPLEDIFDKIEAVDAARLQQMANRLFCSGARFQVKYW